MRALADRLGFLQFGEISYEAKLRCLPSMCRAYLPSTWELCPRLRTLKITATHPLATRFFTRNPALGVADQSW